MPGKWSVPFEILLTPSGVRVERGIAVTPGHRELTGTSFEPQEAGRPAPFVTPGPRRVSAEIGSGWPRGSASTLGPRQASRLSAHATRNDCSNTARRSNCAVSGTRASLFMRRQRFYQQPTRKTIGCPLVDGTPASCNERRAFRVRAGRRGIGLVGRRSVLCDDSASKCERLRVRSERHARCDTSARR